MSLSELFNDPRLTQASQGAQQAYASAAQSAGQEISLPEMLKQALTAKFSRDNPLIQQQEQARKGFLTAADLARVQYSPTQTQQQFTYPTVGGKTEGIIFSPSQQRALISQAQANALVPLMSLNDIIGAQMGGIGNVVESTGKALGAQTAARTLQATGAQQTFKNLFDILSGQVATKQKEEELAISRLKAVRGEDGLDFPFTLPGAQTLQPPHEGPLFSPPNNGYIEEMDDGTIWQFQDSQWVYISDPSQLK